MECKRILCVLFLVLAITLCACDSIQETIEDSKQNVIEHAEWIRDNHAGGDNYDEDLANAVIDALKGEDEEHIVMVKTGMPNTGVGITYGDAFANFFDEPSWRYFVGEQEGPDEDGDGEPDFVNENIDVVEFTGKCLYQDVEVSALVQFTIDVEAGTCQATYLSFNDVPQNMLILTALLDKVFEEAVAEYGITPPEDTAGTAGADESLQSQAEAYASVISLLQQKYGEGSYSEDGEPSGLVVVRQIDFDRDGTTELLCAYRNTNYDTYDANWTIEYPYCSGDNCDMCYEIWGWQNGDAVLLAHEPLLGSMAVDDFDIRLLSMNGKTYILRADGDIFESVYIASTVQKNKWTEAVHLFAAGDDVDALSYFNLDVEIPESEFYQLREGWFQNDSIETIAMWYGNDQLQQTNEEIFRLT